MQDAGISGRQRSLSHSVHTGDNMSEDYRKAKRLGDRAVREAAQAGRSTVLPALDEILSVEDKTPYYVGVMEIPMALVTGTKTRGRQNAFAPDFMPLMDQNSEFASKWDALFVSQLEEGIRDPIRVYEYLRHFYVQEGNKRVSVSRYVGSASILAEVYRILPEASDEPEIRQYYEFLKFFEVAPVYEIELTAEGAYKRLAELVGQDLEHVWTPEAVRDLKYYYSVFRRAFLAKGGWKLHMTAGDALLVYLTIYGWDRLREDTYARIEQSIGKIWNELRLKEQGDAIDVQETPEEEEKEPALFGILRRNPGYSPEKPLRAAFIYDSTPELSRWCYVHELGRNELKTRFGGAVETIRFDSCRTDEEIRKAVDDAVSEGSAMVFTTSSNQMQETLRCAIHFPEIRFFNCSVNLSHTAVQTYYTRMYGAKFLMGALAGSLAENHRIGYRAAYPIYGALADINAFAIGAALTDPKAEIYLSWASMEEEKWNQSLTDNDIRIVSGPDNIRPETASKEFGVYERLEDGGIRNLAAPFWNWGQYYERMLRPVVEGHTVRSASERQEKAINYWWGMSAGVVDVILSEKLSYYSRKMVSALKNSLILGRMNPFDGELRSREGIVKEAGTPRLSSEEIIRMNWLNDNIIGRIPEREELPESVQDKIEVSGIRTEESRPVSEPAENRGGSGSDEDTGNIR